MASSRAWRCPACGNVAVYEAEAAAWCEEDVNRLRHPETEMQLCIVTPLTETRKGWYCEPRTPDAWFVTSYRRGGEAGTDSVPVLVVPMPKEADA